MWIVARWEAALRRKSQAAAFSLLGAGFLLVGLGFFTAALWIILAELRDQTFAALAIGGGFFGLGLVVIGIGRIVGRTRVPPPPVTTAAALPIAQIVEGFVLGIEAGREARRRGRSRDGDAPRSDDGGRRQ